MFDTLFRLLASLVISLLPRSFLPNELAVGWTVAPGIIEAVVNKKFQISANSVDVFLAAVKACPDKDALVFADDGSTWSYTQLNQKANRISNWLLKLEHTDKNHTQPLLPKPHGNVALLLPNNPDLVSTWIALWKCAQTISLINTSLKGDSLAHVLRISSTKLLITSPEFMEVLIPVMARHEFQDWTVICLCSMISSSSSLTIPSLPHQQHLIVADKDALMASSPENPPTKFKDSVKSHHKALLIFTSGTTGFPKAAVLTHERFKLSNGGCKLLGLTGDDRIYSCLPLFHTTGAGLALGNAWTNRCTLILSSRFSASKVMPHCCTYNATALVYVGEICRYLLASPPNPNCDSKHQIRKVFGNGLRKDIWLDFKHRFNIPEVIEFYGSTEGNIFMFNRQIGDEIGVGAVGRAGVILRTVAFQFEVVKYDVENDIPLRDENGRCIKCENGQVGELLGKIQIGHPSRDFKGYHMNDEGTRKKILKDVFKKGDLWFRSGDLMSVDDDAYFYFVDRIGDTFRWKGHNVSTQEVSAAFAKIPGVVECIVYGVEVPHVSTGRAGMAAIVVDHDRFNIQLVHQILERDAGLPPYAIPIWIRIVPELEKTGTFKSIKRTYQTQRMDPSLVGKDPLYWVAPGSKTYSKFVKETFNSLASFKL